MREKLLSEERRGQRGEERGDAINGSKFARIHELGVRQRRGRKQSEANGSKGNEKVKLQQDGGSELSDGFDNCQRLRKHIPL
eukprot:765810-Hanusia_phi.AAC.1